MKTACILFSLVGCVLSVACVTRKPVEKGVSDAWLDTPRRPHSQLAGPKNGLTHWKTGLPPARKAAAVSQTPRAGKDWRAGGGVTAPAPSIESSSRYGVVHTRYLDRSRYHHHVRGGSQSGYVRHVEKVGPSIVPQLSVPLSTRSYSGGPPLLPRTGVAIVPVPTPRTRGAGDVRGSRDGGYRHRRH